MELVCVEGFQGLHGEVRMGKSPGGYAPAKAGFVLHRDLDGDGAVVRNWRQGGVGSREKLSEDADFEVEAGGQGEIGIAAVKTCVADRTLEGVIRLPEFSEGG